MPSWAYAVLSVVGAIIFIVLVGFIDKIWPRHPLWISRYRICCLTKDKVVVTPPIFFGCSYVFDGRRRLVSIRRRFLAIIPAGKTKIPFSDIVVNMCVWEE